MTTVLDRVGHAATKRFPTSKRLFSLLPSHHANTYKKATIKNSIGRPLWALNKTFLWRTAYTTTRLISNGHCIDTGHELLLTQS